MLKLPEVAQRLGVSEKTARRYIKAGAIPSVFIGNAYRIREEDLEEYVRLAHVEPRGVDVPKADAPPSPEPEKAPKEERRTLAERRLLSPLEPFAKQVEDRTAYWRGLAESGQVNQYTVDYATEELGSTARSFKILVDAAIAEHWSGAELGLLRRVYESINSPYHLAWKALIETYVESFTKSFDDPNVVSLRRRGDEAMRELEEAEETVRTAA